MKQLSIIGLGLMGGSLALAARKRRVAKVVCGHARREETRREALERGVVDCACESVAECVAEADMVVFCLPVLAIPEAAAQCRGSFRRGCRVTDVGSTKEELSRRMQALLAGTGASFVGSHPIAGGDETGIGAVRPDLYRDAVVVVTPEPGGDPADTAAVRQLWEGIGAEVVIRSPAEHDAVLARTSHLPHMVASALVRAVLEGDPAAGRFCGSGFRDATRIAGGASDVWHDIVKTNRTALLAELRGFERALGELTGKIAEGDFEGVRRYLADSRRLRLEWKHGSGFE